MSLQEEEDGIELIEKEIDEISTEHDEKEALVYEESARTAGIDQEIEIIGEGYFHKRTVVILGLGNVADAVEILAIGYILASYEETEGKLTPWQSSCLTAAVFAGMLVGGFSSGLLSDKYGRRPLLLTTLALNGVSGVGAAISPNVTWLIFFRLFAGLGVGGTVTCLFALCVEHLPSTCRGFYVTILCSFWMVGSVCTAATAWIMLGNYSDGSRIMEISWRWFALVVSLPSFLCLVLSYNYVPESARYLVAANRPKEAEAVLVYIHRLHNSSHSPRLTKEKYSLKVEDTRSTIDRIFSLFRGGLFRSTILLLGISFCQSYSSYGLSTWITKLFKSVGLSNPYFNAFLFAGANLPGNLSSMYLIERVDRKTLLGASMYLAGLSTMLFAFHSDDSAVVVVTVACAFSASATSAWNAFGVITAESFPTRSRATGMALINGIGRFGSICAQFVNGYLVAPPPNVTALLMITTTVMSAGGTCALLLPRETKGALLDATETKSDDA